MATAPDPTLFPFDSEQERQDARKRFEQGHTAPNTELWGSSNEWGRRTNCYTFTEKGAIVNARDWMEEHPSREPEDFHQMLHDNQLTHEDMWEFRTKKRDAYFGFTPEASEFLVECETKASSLYDIRPNKRKDALRKILEPLLNMCPSVTDELLTEITTRLADDWYIRLV